MSWLSVARVSLAGRDAAAAVTDGRIVPGLKWPNDLVVDDLKLAGVLAEVDGSAVVVGIGMNVGWAPPDLPATMLGDDITRDAVLDALLDSLAGWLTTPDTEVAAAYRAACVTLNRSVRVELADEEFTGTASDVTDGGHLLVDIGTCIRDVAAGDVVHLR